MQEPDSCGHQREPGNQPERTGRAIRQDADTENSEPDVGTHTGWKRNEREEGHGDGVLWQVLSR